MKKVFSVMMTALALLYGVHAEAEDHVMAATRPVAQRDVPARLSLSIEEAQQYAVETNRSLRNASMAIQEAYAQRWQTIAAMLPQADLSYQYQSMFGYKMDFGQMSISMPDNGSLGVSASVGISGQAVIGALLNTVAIDMQKLAYEQNELDLRANVVSSYASVLVLQDIVGLLDSSLVNVERLAEMTQRSVDVGAAEQTAADQIMVRVNSLKNSINSNKRNVQLAESSLKVLLDVPVETELVLTTSLDDMLSAEAVLNLLGEDFVLENNVSYRQLEKNVDLAKKNVHMAAWAYGPTVGVGYQYSKQWYYGEGGFRMTPPNAVAVSVSMPLWSSGKRAAGVTEKKIALEKARNTLEETTNQLGIQNQQLRFDLQNAFETYMNEKENMDVTQRVFASTTNKYRYGATSNLELVNASNDVISAQSTYVQAVLSLVNAELALTKFLNKQ
ncbi:MAG: TolC family protein [Paludibacteraceae bacterium]